MFKKLITLIVVLSLPIGLFSATTGKIVGTITDRETGDPLPGANIVIDGTSMGAASGVDGRFVILNIPVGTYSVSANFIGYQKESRLNVRVNQDLTTSVDFGLPSEAIELSAIITIAERPLVNPNITNSMSITSAEDLKVLPLRGFRNVVSIKGGVTSVAGRTYVRGGRREEIATYIDGVYQNLPLNGLASGDIATNAIEEVSFQAGGFNAEYGFANSGVINITSKTGANNYKFSAEVISDSWLSKTSKTLGAYSYGQDIFNFSISGPVPGFAKSRKLKFHFSGERQLFDDHTPSGFAFQKLMMDADGNPLDASGNRITFAVADGETGPAINGGFNLGDAFPQFDDDGVIKEYQFEEQGPWANRAAKNWLWNANISYQATSSMKFIVGGNSRRNEQNDLAGFSPGADLRNVLDGAGIGFTLWNSENNPRRESQQDSYFAKLTQTLGSRAFYTIQANYFRDDFKLTSDRFGDAFWNIGDFGDVVGATGPGADGDSNAFLEQNGQPPNADVRSADLFSPFGQAPGRYQKREWRFFGLKGDYLQQFGQHHEVKAGFEYRRNTYRLFDIGGYGSADLARLAGNLVNVGSGISAESSYQNRFADSFGFDIFGNKTDAGGRNGAKHPVFGAFYLQDKLEFSDLVVNVGLRYDYFEPDNDAIADLLMVVTETNDAIGGVLDLAEENFTSSESRTALSPRLGISFPVSDQTVFHAQYGKFVQTPELNRMYVSTIQYAQNLQSGNFFTNENPNLDLIRTTAYEVGFRNQLGDNAAIDITAYYKEIRNYVRLENLREARPVPYAVFQSQDYGTVKGLTLAYTLRPSNRISAHANYTLQYAAGTGSDANSLRTIAWQGTANSFPTFVAPLDFDQRHTGTFNVDFRTPASDGKLLGRVGANLLFTFGSGLSYTPTQINTEVLPGSNSQIPIGQFGGAQGPWTYQLDLKVDKTFNMGRSTWNAYVWVINLTGALNANWVYGATGQADTDGYLDSPEGQNFVNTWGPNGVALYNFLLQTPNNVGPPRQIRLGLKFEI